jgi:hypothetical protein
MVQRYKLGKAIFNFCDNGLYRDLKNDHLLTNDILIHYGATPLDTPEPKIEKLIVHGFYGTRESWGIINKINEIIDYINTHPKAREEN